MKKLFLPFFLTVLLVTGGVLRFDYLATKPMDRAEFSWFNKVEIYTGYLSMMAVGYPIYPEISKEMWYMLFPSSRNQEIVFEDDFFKNSKVIKSAIEKYRESSAPQKLYWHLSNYSLGKSEARVSLAFNGGTLSIKDQNVIVKVPCAFPRYTNYQDHSVKSPLIKIPVLNWEIGVQEGLFWILEKEGWIYPYTAIWKYSQKLD